MPFQCEQRGGKWKCVSTDSGKVHGTHDNKGQCEAQKRALYANYQPTKSKGK